MATTFTLNRRTYSTALDSTPLVVDEIDYLNYLEKSFAEEDYDAEYERDRRRAIAAAAGIAGAGSLGYAAHNLGKRVTLSNRQYRKMLKSTENELKGKSEAFGKKYAEDRIADANRIKAKLLKAEDAKKKLKEMAWYEKLPFRKRKLKKQAAEYNNLVEKYKPYKELEEGFKGLSKEAAILEELKNNPEVKKGVIESMKKSEPYKKLSRGLSRKAVIGAALGAGGLYLYDRFKKD